MRQVLKRTPRFRGKSHREAVPLNDGGKDDMSNKSPGHHLKALRMRAGVSSTDLGKALGFSNANGYLRYENNPPYTEGKKIPARIITSIIPLLVGKGEPPVTRDELVAISDMADLAGVMGEIKQSEALFRAATGQPTFVFPQSDGPGLPIRYRIEGDVYMPEAKLRERASGRANLLPDPRYPAEVQFAVLVADASCGDYAPVGSILHCIEPGAATHELQETTRFVVAQHNVGQLAEVRIMAYGNLSRDQKVLGVPIWRILPA